MYKENIQREINLINKFSYPYGGIRYLDKSKSSYYMLRPNTCAILEDLISYIKENIDINKDITDLTF